MKISFIVPTRNSDRTLARCLTSLNDQDHADVEVIVVDNFSTDATPEIGRKHATVFHQSGPERCAQRNKGAALATGDVVVYIDSDMVLEPGVAADIAATFATQPDVGALVIPELAFGERFFADCRSLEKRLYLGDERVEAVRAIRREAVELVGGWDETLTAGEDWDLSDRLRAAGIGFGRIEARIWHDEGQIRLRETFAKKRYYGRWVGVYLARHGHEGNRKLARTSLLSQPGLLLRQPRHAAGMFLLKATEAAGIAAGMADARRHQFQAA